MEYQLGCDIGGTFTDVVAIDAAGRFYSDKSDTTVEDLSQGVVAALENLAARIGISLRELLATTTRFVNGTTSVTNCIAELKGARVGLITTRGFGDNLLIARSPRNRHRDHHFQVNLPQIVPRERVVEVAERVDRKGQVVVALTEAEARRAVNDLLSAGVEAIAVSLLWSFRNPVHEELIAEIVEREDPGLFLSVSSRLHPKIREYERTMTTVLNAFTGIRVAQYTARIENVLASRGLRISPVFMQGFGGTLSPQAARERPIALVDSGPAAGVIGAQALAQRLGVHNMVTADMGGTSFDVSVLLAGRTRVVERVLLREQFLTAVPKIDVLPIGAGGGSIAWLDARRAPQVGPRSSGADPGPACYGKGGSLPTVTDASVVLGLLDPTAFLSGRRALDAEASRAALLRQVGEPLGLSAEEAAAAVYRLVTANMSSGVRAVTVERGQDPRKFAMLAYGGALGVFATDIARSLGIRQVVLPPDAAVFSAHGLLASDDVRTLTVTVMWSGGDATEILETLRRLDAEAVRMLREVGHADDRITVEWQGELKFAGQQWELLVDIPRKPDVSTTDLLAIQENFATLYEAEYGPGTAWIGSPVLLGSVRVVATGAVDTFEPAALDERPFDVRPDSSRKVYLPLEAVTETVDVYAAHRLTPGARLTGPAIVEHDMTTVQVSRGWRLDVDRWQNFVMTDTLSRDWLADGAADADAPVLAGQAAIKGRQEERA